MTRSSLIAASAALNQTPLDWTGNRDRILRAIALARAEGADVLCLPELCVSGYGCEDSFHSESVAAYAMASLLEIAPHTQEMAVAAGLPVMHRGRLYNGVALMAGGRVVGFGAKRVLAGYGVYYEPRWFTPWKSGAVDWITLATPQGTQNVPMGDLAFNLDGVVVAFEICEEAWGRSTPPGGVSGKWSGRGDVETLAEAAPPEGAISSLETPPLPGGSRPFLETPPLPGGSRHSLETQPEMGGELSDGMADLILNPSASHFAFGKHSTTRNIVLEGSRESQAGYLYANLLGNESGRLIFDGSALVASGGTLLAATPRFSYAGVQVACAGVDIRANRLERRRRAYPPDMADRPPPRPVRVDFSFRQPLGLPPQAAPGALRQPEGNTPQPNGALHPPDGALHPPNTTSWDSALSPAENTRREFTRAVALGLFDYLRKSRSRGLMVSLSGGVDSSTVAVLGWAMIKLALAELGEEGLQAALGHIPGLDGLTGPDPARFARRLITTVYQATANSTPVTREAAASVARYLGVRHLELDVEPLVAKYEALAATALGRPPAWESDDAARQNIQARVRSPGIWLLANMEGFLLLSTSNRSEAGVGYCTMDGDTSGGLAPIAGANKTFLRDWLAWAAKGGDPALGALSVLDLVNRQSPTAELRPPDRGQTDEADLMPYPVLDAIERAAIRDRLAPLAVWRHLLNSPPAGIRLTPRQAADHVEKFFRLWSATQWKRERLAPSFHLDDENLDPKTWCRFPILSGGYASELEELRNAVNQGEKAP